MNIRLSDPEVDFSLSITHESPILLCGSCFVDEIGSKLALGKFDVVRNPFGIVYNPDMLLRQLRRLLADDPVREEELIWDQGLWHSFYHHGHFSGEEKSEVLAGMKRTFDLGREQLLKARYLFLTFGTSQVYLHIERDMIVSNCHRIPQKAFRRKRLGISEQVSKWKEFLPDLFSVNPDLEVIYTVSPVRHLRDGLVENNRSKATLLLLASELAHHFEQVHYLPVYEFTNDVLRDYRFFGRDLVHPNDLAVDLIWSWFDKLFFGENTRKLLAALDKVNRAVAHRPMYGARQSLVTFAENQLTYINLLKKSYPELDLSEEIAYFNSLKKS